MNPTQCKKEVCWLENYISKPRHRVLGFLLFWNNYSPYIYLFIQQTCPEPLPHSKGYPGCVEAAEMRKSLLISTSSLLGKT
jgi:hypothetical protein